MRGLDLQRVRAHGRLTTGVSLRLMPIVTCADSGNVDYTKWTREELLRLRGQLEAEAADGSEITAVAQEIQRRDAVTVDAASVPATVQPITSAARDGLSTRADAAEPNVEHKAFHLSGRSSSGRGWRKMTWALHAWNAVFLIWIVWGIAKVGEVASGTASSCAQDAAVLNGILSQQECEDASNAGVAIGASIGLGSIFMFWFIGFVVLAIVWFMTKPATRPCPVCGDSVRKGETACESCGHDFAQAALLATRGVPS
jgi:hypothetical protein